MNATQTTIYDVAKASNVSIATVSRVLNTPQQVRETTRKKVLHSIERLQFVPKAAASEQARKRLKRIGVLLPQSTMFSCVERLRGIKQVLNQSGDELIGYDVADATQFQQCLALILASKRVDGLIVMSLPCGDWLVQRLNARGIDVVCLDTPTFSGSLIQSNYERGGQLAATHLLDKGYRRVAYIGGLPILSQVFDGKHHDTRLQGFQRTLRTNSITLDDSCIRWTSALTKGR